MNGLTLNVSSFLLLHSLSLNWSSGSIYFKEVIYCSVDGYFYHQHKVRPSVMLEVSKYVYDLTIHNQAPPRVKFWYQLELKNYVRSRGN
ncbi:unnamed protein product [Acanthoscelides obtectus]|uniref:Uncharacterized protein n=1 Tax=Acanthoscelides obtectus TaxID=200917 RepID=A0A9P0KIT6_ACAOB|nr:unnamed protein product [Acanthoscelides obtectus]CAK1623701.1 hypothetical protein AOBTE_LOCUS2129 [Acanthoscelides obtectus]